MKNTNSLLLTVLFLGLHLHIHAHPDKVENLLAFHFATGAHPPANGTWEDLTHPFTATHGMLILTNIGSALALQFNGSSDHTFELTKQNDR